MGLASVPSDRTVWWAAFAALFLLFATWALASPVMSGPDEPAHAIRAAQIGHGELFGETEVIRSLERGNATFTTARVPEGWGQLWNLNCFRGAEPRSADCLPPVPDEGRMGSGMTTAGTYQPLYYAAVGWVAGPLGLGSALLAMRLLTAVLAAALTASAVLSIRSWPRPGAGMLGLLAGLTPMVAFLGGVVNPSAVEITAALCVWTSLIALLAGDLAPDRRAVTRVSFALIAMAWARPSSVFLLVAVVSVIVVLAPKSAVVRGLVRDRFTQRAVALVAVCAVASLAWGVLSGALDSFGGAPQPDLTNADIVSQSWELTPVRFEHMIGVLGWLDTRLDWIWEPWLEVVGALAVVALLVGSWRQRLALALLMGGVLALPLVAELQSARLIGFAWQGRYSLPVSIGIPVVAMWIVDRRLEPPEGALRLVLAGMGATFAAWHVVAHGYSMGRYSLGPGAPWGRYLVRPGWEAPVPDVPLLALVAVAVTAIVAVALVVSRPPASLDVVDEDAVV